MAMVVWDPLGILDKYASFQKLKIVLVVSQSKNVGFGENSTLTWKVMMNS